VITYYSLMRFGLRALLGFFTWAMLLVCLCFTLPIPVANSVVAFLTFVVSASVLVGLVYGNGLQRAFCLGASVPLIFELLNSAGTELAVYEQTMVAIYSCFRPPPDPFARALDGPFFLRQSAVLFTSFCCGALGAFAAPALRKRAPSSSN
jgi:hypothetical protein